jgi:hypothetical protein
VNKRGRRRDDLTGRSFGRLTVERPAKSDKRGWWWECICECGFTKVVRGDNLKSGNTKSCGCRQQDHLLSRRAR